MERKLVIVSVVFLLWTGPLITSANQEHCYAPMICDGGPAWINLTTSFQEEATNHLLKSDFFGKIKKMTDEVETLQDGLMRLQKAGHDLQPSTTVETPSPSNSANQQQCYAPIICDDGPDWINFTALYQDEVANLVEREFLDQIKEMTDEVAILQERFMRMQKARRDLQPSTTVETPSSSNSGNVAVEASTPTTEDASSSTPIATVVTGTSTITTNYPALITPIATSITGTSTLSYSYARSHTPPATTVIQETTAAPATIAVETSTITAEDASSSTPIVTIVTGTSAIATNDPASTTPIATSIAGTSTNDPASTTPIATIMDETTTNSPDSTTPIATSIASTSTNDPESTTPIATIMDETTTNDPESTTPIATIMDETTTNSPESTTPIATSIASTSTNDPESTTPIATSIASTSTNDHESTTPIATITAGITTNDPESTTPIATTTAGITTNDPESTTPIATTTAGTSTNDPESTNPIATSIDETSTATSSDVTSPLVTTVIQKTTTKPGCPQTSLTFPRDGEVEDYVLYNGSTVPQLVNVSICAWLTPPTGGDIVEGPVLSYYKYDSNDEYGNTMLIYFWSNNQSNIAGIVTPGSGITFRLDQPVRDRTHFCFLMSTAERKTELFRNGISLGQKDIPSNAAIPAGGALVIGNDQDRVADPNAFLGSMTQPWDTFTGTIENLYIWSRILSGDEIGRLRNDPCACPRDHMIALTAANVETHGQTQVSSLRNDCD